MPEQLPPFKPDQCYREVIQLTDGDRALIAACEFMVGHAANPFVTALDAWIEDPDATHMRPLLLQHCQERTKAIALKLQRIGENLPHLQNHAKADLAALHAPMTESYRLLQNVHRIGQQLTEVLAANMTAPIDPTSALTAELTVLDSELRQTRAAFAPLMPQVNNNPAYQSYRAVVGERGRYFNK